MMEWIDMDYKLPDDNGTYYLVAKISNGVIWDWDKARYSQTAKSWMKGSFHANHFTHWMPLPPPKK